MAPTAVDITSFVATQKSYLEREFAAELESAAQLRSSLGLSALQSKGLALVNLRVTDSRTALGGKGWAALCFASHQARLDLCLTFLSAIHDEA
jgi:hypothetical protein